MSPNRNAVRSKKMLRKAYAELVLLGKDKITVSAVCKQAGLSRNTMYAHYSNVTALAEDVWHSFERRIEQCAEQTRRQQNNGSVHLLLLYYARLIQEEEENCRAWSHTPWYDNFIKKLEETFVQFMFSKHAELAHDTDFAVATYVVTGAMLELYTKYLQDKLEIPLQQINDRIMSLCNEEMEKLNEPPETMEVECQDCTSEKCMNDDCMNDI